MAFIFACLLVILGLWAAAFGISNAVDTYQRYSPQGLKNSNLVGLYPMITMIGIGMSALGCWLLGDFGRGEKRPQMIEEDRRHPTAAPDDYASLYQSGLSFRKLAQRQRDKNLYRDAIKRFEAALGKKPDDYDALYELSGSFVDLWRLTGDLTQLENARGFMERQLQINPRDAFLAACIYARLGDEANCREQLSNAKNLDVLPRAEVLTGECDLESMRDKAWFRALVLP